MLFSIQQSPFVLLLRWTRQCFLHLLREWRMCLFLRLHRIQRMFHSLRRHSRTKYRQIWWICSNRRITESNVWKEIRKIFRQNLLWKSRLLSGTNATRRLWLWTMPSPFRWTIVKAVESLPTIQTKETWASPLTILSTVSLQAPMEGKALQHTKITEGRRTIL